MRNQSPENRAGHNSLYKIAVPVITAVFALTGAKMTEAQDPTLTNISEPYFSQGPTETPIAKAPTPTPRMTTFGTAAPTPEPTLTPSPVIGDAWSSTPKTTLIGPETSTPDPNRPLNSTPTQSAAEIQGAPKTAVNLPETGGNPSSDNDPINPITALATGTAFIGAAETSRRFAKKK